MPNPENPQDQNNENLEQKPINPENDWIAKEQENFEKMTPEKKQEVLDVLAKELKEKYEHVGPGAQWGADDVAPERGIIKKEKGNVEIQSRDEFLDSYLKKYSKENLNNQEEKLENEVIQEQSKNQNEYQKQLNENEYENIAEKTLNKEDLETSAKKGVDNLSAEQLKEIEKDYLDQQETMKGISDQEQYINEQPKGETDDYQERLKENEYENIAEITKNQEDFEYPRAENPDNWTEEQIAEKENDAFEQEERISEISSNEDEQQKQLKEYAEMEEELQNKEGGAPAKEDNWAMKGWKAFASWFEDTAINFVFSIPSRIWDFTNFIWTWANKILEGNPGWAGKELDTRGAKRYNKQKKEFEKMIGADKD